MKKIFLIMVIMAFHASLLSQDAEEKKTDNIKRKNAILFNFDGFNLNSFNGGFGWKKWISNSIAVNSKFKILLSKEEKERTDELSGSESRQKSGFLNCHILLTNTFLDHFSAKRGTFAQCPFSVPILVTTLIGNEARSAGQRLCGSYTAIVA